MAQITDNSFLTVLEFKLKVPAGLVPGEDSCDLGMTSSHCVLTWLLFMPTLEERPRGREVFCVSSSFYKDTVILD